MTLGGRLLSTNIFAKCAWCSHAFRLTTHMSRIAPTYQIVREVQERPDVVAGVAAVPVRVRRLGVERSYLSVQRDPVQRAGRALQVPLLHCRLDISVTQAQVVPTEKVCLLYFSFRSCTALQKRARPDSTTCDTPLFLSFFIAFNMNEFSFERHLFSRVSKIIL